MADDLGFGFRKTLLSGGESAMSEPSVLFSCLIGLRMMAMRRGVRPPLDLTDEDFPIQYLDVAAGRRIDIPATESAPVVSTTKQNAKSPGTAVGC